MAITYPRNVRVVEVGPRDGLQNEKQAISSEAKIKYIDLLGAAGFSAIEVTSFVSPKSIPQLADATEVFAAIDKHQDVSYPVLVPNLHGMERALEAQVRAVAVFTAASESFTRANINATIAESLSQFRPVIELARQHNIHVRGYISTAFGCPYEGTVPPARVIDVAQRLLDLGVDELSIGDTIGVATPNQVTDLIEQLVTHIDIERLAMHFHDTRGTALANVLAALGTGITIFDSAAGGVGGCPYAPGAAGNLATEDLLYMLHGMGIATGIDLAAVVRASRYLMTLLSRSLTSKYLQATISQASS
jgi:hydroxymethylglutaryl-CoA lyase